jgi:glycosyltransferase involved in cell wall biosynthesis
MTPRVTVLLAVHNGEPYVGDAIASVLAQTYRDFEFVIVDDASTDGTVATIESFGDERIRLLRNERNIGQVPSLNRGLREARGEIVARIDADDVSRPTRLERQLAVLDASPRVGLVGSWMTLVDARGRHVGALRKSLVDYVDFVYHTLIMRVYVSHPAAAFRLEPVLQLGGYDESTGPAEDKDLWRKLALERWDARIVPEELVQYRLHDAQLSQTRATYQRDVDARSQERFLAELAPDAPVRPVRMLLADDIDLWRERFDIRATLSGVDQIKAGARARLGLSADEAARIDTLVATRLLHVAAGRPWSSRARTIAGYARRGGASPTVGTIGRAAAAPIRAVGTSTLRRASAAAPFLRAPIRRVPTARRAYEKLVGQETGTTHGRPTTRRGPATASTRSSRRQRVERDVTLVVKSFERPHAPLRLVESVRRFYPEMAIVLVDDSATSIQGIPDDVEHCRLPFNSGAAAGRNEGLRRVRTPYVLFADDDHVFGEETKIERMLRVLERTDFDIVSCRSLEHRPDEAHPWEKHFAGTLDLADGLLRHCIGATRGYRNGLPVYDIVLQFFLADRARLGEDPWDPRLKIGPEHQDFFLTAKKRGLSSTKISRSAIHHYAEWSSPGYMSVRLNVEPYVAIWRQKWGIEQEVVETVSGGRALRAAHAWRRAGSLVRQGS